MKYSTTIKKGTYDRPIGEFDKNGRVVYNKYEHYDIDVLEITMQTSIKNDEDVKKLAILLYPELISVLGENQYVGVRVQLERSIKTLFKKNESLKDFQRSLLRQYSAMKLDINIFGLSKEN